jgi:DNA-binding CsgD family transcriptional regulator
VPILSSREKEVLDLIADGFTNPQIAEKLFLSLHTVDSHRKNLLTKFGINNTASLIKLAAKYNML